MRVVASYMYIRRIRGDASPRQVFRPWMAGHQCRGDIQVSGAQGTLA